jgi:hypothetical protein
MDLMATGSAIKDSPVEATKGVLGSFKLVAPLELPCAKATAGSIIMKNK